MINDRLITISVGNSRKSINWQNTTLMLSEFYEKLRYPVRRDITHAEFMKLPKAKQDELKDVGGHVGGKLSGPRRKAVNLLHRDLITLDIDNVVAGGTFNVLQRLDSLGMGYVVHCTIKHYDAAPRLRVYTVLDRPATPDEHEPVARMMARLIDPTMGMVDPTTFDIARLMYAPVICSDVEYVYHFADKPFASVDGLLALYKNWRDVSEWPAVPGAQATIKRLLDKQGVPETKTGVVGAFCRAYDVRRVIDELLPGTYEPVDNSPDRYTFTGGSTAGGAVVYEGGKFLYSHHSTDPCGGKLVNAFDLVRLHKFGELDDADDVKEGTPSNRLPSYTAMCGFAIQDTGVSSQMAVDDFPDVADFERSQDAGLDWAMQLTRDQNGVFHKTLNNIMLLIQNAPELYGGARRDDFSGRICTSEKLPWRTDRGYWSDADTTELRKHFETQYKGYRPGKQDIKDAIVASSMRQKYHPVRDYLIPLVWDGRMRLDTLFIDYLGVADSEYTRAVTRKALVGAVSRVMSPGCKFDYMLVFVGNQGRGKSSIIYKLAGGDEWFTDSLVTFDGKSAFEAVTGKWLIEVPEMHAFDKATMNQAKAFISKQSDFYRAAYAEFPEDRRRQCVFFGTTNNRDCLRDETGGRRFWPLITDAVDRKKNIFTELAAERDQIWAEAVSYWRAGESLYLPPELEGIAAERQEAHREAHPWEDTIKNFINHDVPEDWDDWELNQRLTFWSGNVTGSAPLVKRAKVCVREIWQEALMMSLATLDQQKSRAITGTLNRLKEWQKGGSLRFGKVYGVQKGYIRIVTESNNAV